MGAVRKAGGTAEWRDYWFLPLVAALGYSTSSLQSYAMGPFFAPLQAEFGWSRAQVSSGITICNTGAALFLTALGPLIDRFGPRRIGLIGVALMAMAFGSLSAATGSMIDWWLHWALISFCALWVQGTIWTGAVVSRFHASRGTAIAVTVSGNSVATALLPPLTTWLIAQHGWRGGFIGLGLIWGLLLLPLIYLFFRGAQDVRHKPGAGLPTAAGPLPGLGVREGLRRPAFYKLVLIGICFAFTTIGAVVHFVPILTSAGAAPMAAASVAALVGIFSIVGRLGTGPLLDRFPAHLVGFCAYLVPIVGAAALLLHGAGTAGQIVAAIAFGLTVGSEADIIIYLVTRHFGLRSFGTLMAAIFSAIALGAAFGPLAAGAAYDMSGGYAPYLILSVVLTGISALVMLSLRCPPEFEPPAA